MWSASAPAGGAVVVQLMNWIFGDLLGAMCTFNCDGTGIAAGIRDNPACHASRGNSARPQPGT